MEGLRRLAADLVRAGKLAMIAGSLVLFAASLFQPFADGAEIFGVMPGWMFLWVSLLFGIMAIFRAPLVFLTGLAYLALPLSVLVAKYRPWLAAGLVAFGLTLTIWFLASNGLYIGAARPRPGPPILNTGCLCLLFADLFMLAAWISTGLGSRAGRTGTPQRNCDFAL
jgi:hypothetical protein